MGNLNPREIYMPKDFRTDANIMSLVSSFRLITPDVVMSIISKPITHIPVGLDSCLAVLRGRIHQEINKVYRECPEGEQRKDDRIHDHVTLASLTDALRPCLMKTFLISPEYANLTVRLESDPSVSARVDDVLKLMAYNTGLAEATSEFEKHLHEMKKE